MIPVHVLVVEDEDAFADYIEARLSRATKLRAVVSRVSSCSAMQQALNMKNFDLILLDLSLPDSHGVDTVAGAVRIAPNTPIVVLSGHDDMEVATVSLRAGAQDFVVKKQGFTTDDLERPMLYALVRAKNEADSKKLYMAARQTLTDAPSIEGSVMPEMVEPYLDKVEEIVDAILSHLRSNSPAQAEAVEAILEKHRFWLTIKDARSTLNIGGYPTKKNTAFIAAEALSQLIQDSSDRDTPIPKTRADAEARLLEILGSAANDLPPDPR